jgi:hypothetical protein
VSKTVVNEPGLIELMLLEQLELQLQLYEAAAVDVGRFDGSPPSGAIERLDRERGRVLELARGLVLELAAAVRSS